MARRPTIPAHTLTDLVFGFALIVVAMLGWSSTYSGSQWLVVGIIGAAIGSGLATLLAGRGLGVSVLLLLLIPAYLLTVGPVTSVVRLDHGMFVEVIGGTTDSWLRLMGTHLPIESAGQFLLPPYVVGLIGAGLTTGVALSSREGAAPLVPPVLVFALVQVLGAHDPGHTIGLALAFGALALVWTLLRSLRVDVTQSAFVWLARAAIGMTAIAVGVGVTAVLAPRLSLHEVRFVAREHVPTYDVRDVPTPLSDFRTFTRQLPGQVSNVYDRRILEVTGLPTGTRLRFAALDQYDQRTFYADNDTVPDRTDDRFLRVSGRIDEPSSGRRVFANVSIERPWDGPWVPLAGAIQSFDFDGPGSARRLAGFRYNPATRTGVMTSDLTVQDDYEFATVLTDDTLRRTDQPSTQVDPALFREAKFVDIPAHAWSVGSTSAIDAVFRAATTLRTTGRYSNGALGFETKYLPGQDRARIGPGFIHGSLTGDDEQYATVMALVATRLGVPARVVVGAVVPASGVVRGRDVHAWVELRIADGSWRTLPTDAFTPTTHPEADRFDANPDPSIQLPYLPPEAWPKQPKAARPDPSAPRVSFGSDASWWPWLLLILVLAGIAAVPLRKWSVRRRRTGPAGAWATLVDIARDHGLDVPLGVTRQSQAAALAAPLDLTDLAWATDLAVFGQHEPADLVPRLATATDSIRSQRPLWRRLLAPLHPASLRRTPRYDPVHGG